jgi:tyrosyl-tRNA synthetase
MIGDPSGRSKTRPQLSHDQVMQNATTFKQQAYKILDPQRTRTVFNGEWLEILTFEQIIKLNSRFTLQQILAREDFRKRFDNGEPVHLHEIQYPLIQGWDSVMVKADVEIGGQDQLFNIMVGRDLQREEGQPEQVAFLMPLLVGLDGVQKMSKSYGNYVGVSEPPDSMFGKLMSITDALMADYYVLLLGEECPASHPMEAKKALASRIVARFHSEEAAAAARADFDQRFSKKDLDHADLVEVDFTSVKGDIISLVVAGFQEGYQITRSRSDVRRLIEQGAVTLRGEKITDPKAEPGIASGDVLKLDKTRAVRAT